MFDFPKPVITGQPHFEVTDDLLQRHFGILYTDLEPRKIADIMFQEGHISVHEHDVVTDFTKKHKRLKGLLNILKKRKLYVPFLSILESLQHRSVLETLKTDKKLFSTPCK